MKEYSFTVPTNVNTNNSLKTGEKELLALERKIVSS
jgi:hypothetical protein